MAIINPRRTARARAAHARYSLIMSKPWLSHMGEENDLFFRLAGAEIKPRSL
jgi:hypothetical protein